MGDARKVGRAECKNGVIPVDGHREREGQRRGGGKDSSLLFPTGVSSVNVRVWRSLRLSGIIMCLWQICFCLLWALANQKGTSNRRHGLVSKRRSPYKHTRHDALWNYNLPSLLISQFPDLWACLIRKMQISEQPAVFLKQKDYWESTVGVNSRRLQNRSSIFK